MPPSCTFSNTTIPLFIIFIELSRYEQVPWVLRYLGLWNWTFGPVSVLVLWHTFNLAHGSFRTTGWSIHNLKKIVLVSWTFESGEKAYNFLGAHCGLCCFYVIFWSGFQYAAGVTPVWALIVVPDVFSSIFK